MIGTQQAIIDQMIEHNSRKPLGDGLPPALKKIVYWMATPRSPIDKDKIAKMREIDPEFADHLESLFIVEDVDLSYND